MGYFVRVTGSKSRPVGGRWKERLDWGLSPDVEKAKGFEVETFDHLEYVRTGGEPKVSAPKGSHCQPGMHPLKAGAKVYRLDLDGDDTVQSNYACKSHYGIIPTMDRLREQYRKPYYFNVQYNEIEGSRRK